MAYPVQIIAGLKPSTGDYHKITIYSDDSILIERPFCSLDTRSELPTLRESSWQSHKHLIWLIEPTAYEIIRFTSNGYKYCNLVDRPHLEHRPGLSQSL